MQKIMINNFYFGQGKCIQMKTEIHARRNRF